MAEEQPENEARAAQTTRANVQFLTRHGRGQQYSITSVALTELHRRMDELEWPQDPRGATQGWKGIRTRKGVIFFELPDGMRISGYDKAIHFLAAINVPSAFRDV